MLHVLYLIFNEGYASSIGPTCSARDLSNEAIRLTRAVHHLLPDDGEVAGLLALMLLTDARRPARTGPDGELIPLDEQDRTLWDRHAIAEGVALITDDALAGARSARTSCRPRSPPSTTRRRAPRTPTGRRSSRCTACSSACPTIPMVTLNHAIAAAMVHGPPAGLDAARRRSTPTSGSPATIASTPCARTCSRWPAIIEAAIAHYRGRGRPHDEHPGAELPHDAGRPPSQRCELTLLLRRGRPRLAAERR